MDAVSAPEVEGEHDLLEALETCYPDLYKNMFEDKDSSRVLWKFAITNITHINYHELTYGDVWEYIVDNEDKHDWWML